MLTWAMGPSNRPPLPWACGHSEPSLHQGPSLALYQGGGCFPLHCTGDVGAFSHYCIGDVRAFSFSHPRGHDRCFSPSALGMWAFLLPMLHHACRHMGADDPAPPSASRTHATPLHHADASCHGLPWLHELWHIVVPCHLGKEADTNGRGNLEPCNSWNNGGMRASRKPGNHKLTPCRPHTENPGLNRRLPFAKDWDVLGVFFSSNAFRLTEIICGLR